MTAPLAIHFAYPTWGLMLALIAAIGFVWMTYGPTSAYFSTAKRIGLGALRFFSLLLVCLLIWQPQWQRSVQDAEKPILAVALDLSKSMTLHFDDTTKAYNPLIEALQSRLSNQYDIEFLGFHERVVPFDSLSFTGDETDISAVTRYAGKRYPPERLSALLLLSDGVSTAGTRPASLGRTLDAPVYSLVYGDTLPKPDAAIERVVNNAFVYVGNQLEVQADLSFIELKGNEPVVRLLREGKEVHRETLPTINSDQALHQLRAVVPGAPSEGLITYTLRIDPMGDETFLNNNEYTFYVDAMRTKKRICIVADAPHPDVGALRSALAALEHYEVEVRFTNEEWSGDPDVVVVHNTKLTELQRNALKNRRVGVLQILGPKSDTDPLSGLVQLTSSGSDFERIRPVFRSAFNTFQMDEWWRTTAPELSPLQSFFPRASAVSGSDVLATASIEGISTDRPLIVTGTLNDAPSMLINGLGIWQWRMQVFRELGAHDVFDDWMAVVFRYLGTVQRDERLQLYHAQRHREGRALRIDARVYDAAFTPTTSAEVSIKLFENDEPTYSYTFTPQGDRYGLDIKGLPAGTYPYEATTEIGGDRFRASGTLVVEAYQAEFVRTTAEIKGLRALANKTGGLALAAPQSEDLIELLANRSTKTILKDRIKRAPLIDFWWLLLLLLLSLTSEWYLRRKAGSY